MYVITGFLQSRWYLETFEGDTWSVLNTIYENELIGPKCIPRITNIDKNRIWHSDPKVLAAPSMCPTYINTWVLWMDNTFPDNIRHTTYGNTPYDILHITWRSSWKPLNTNTNTQIHKYANTQISTHKYKRYFKGGWCKHLAYHLAQFMETAMELKLASCCRNMWPSQVLKHLKIPAPHIGVPSNILIGSQL